MKFRQIGDFHEYYSGARRAPYLTIFIGGNHEASNHLFELYYGGWVAPNIYYLGAANVLRFGPLRIAGLSGIWKGYNYNKPHHERLPYNQDDLKSIYHVRELDVRKLLQIRSQVDIGISHDWPRGVEWIGNWRALFAKKDLFEADARAGTLGSLAAKLVLDRLRPTHWFAAHLHCKFSAVVLHKPKEMVVTNGTSIYPEDMGKASDLTRAQNTDEIDLDMDAEEEQPVSSSVVSIGATCIGAIEDQPLSADKDGSSVPESIRAQLPAAFTKPSVQSACIQDMAVTGGIANTTTRFLALDKCLPHRKFLQVLEIDGSQGLQSSQPNILYYDKEWLAITRVFVSDLILGNVSAPSSQNHGEAHYRTAIEAEEAWVEEHLVQKQQMAVPHNFELTAPVYNATIGIGTQEQPREYSNPQTTQFCNMLGIPNHFHMSEEERSKKMKAGPLENAPRRGGGMGHRFRDRGGRGRRRTRSRLF